MGTMLGWSSAAAARGYRATPKKGGWLASAVFGKSFRLTRQADELGHPEYTLAVR